MTVACWGAVGLVGDGTTINELSPAPVPSLSGVTAVASGDSHTCALLADTTMRCWGSDASGALGDGLPATNRAVPVTVAGLSGVTGIGAGSEMSCALLADATVRCWGFNGQGRLGDGTGIDRLSPTQVIGLAGALAPGDHDICVRATDTAGNRSDGAACAQLTIPYGHTAVGDTVPVTFADATGAASPVSATFTGVTVAGESSVTISATGPTPPTTFQLGAPAMYYELSTTATFSEAIVCIDVTGVAYTDESQLHMFHFEEGGPVDVTYTIDPANNVVCGRVTSFSPFIVAEFHDPFTGFFTPIDSQPVRNAAKAGSAIPIRFSLGGDRGLAIFDAGYPASVVTTCDTGSPLDELEEVVSASHSGLSYDRVSGRYTYIWKTSSAWAGTCRQLILRFADGTEHRADFTFRK